MENKRGQGLSTGAIVLIIIGVVVLVILIIGFTLGWKKILPFLSEEDNVDEVVQACQAECVVQSEYGFCQKIMRLKAPNLPGDVEFKDATCQFFSTDLGYANYGVAECPEVTCATP